jgi:hypothetical protein
MRTCMLLARMQRSRRARGATHQGRNENLLSEICRGRCRESTGRGAASGWSTLPAPHRQPGPSSTNAMTLSHFAAPTQCPHNHTNKRTETMSNVSNVTCLCVSYCGRLLGPGLLRTCQRTRQSQDVCRREDEADWLVEAIQPPNCPLHHRHRGGYVRPGDRQTAVRLGSRLCSRRVCGVPAAAAVATGTRAGLRTPRRGPR